MGELNIVLFRDSILSHTSLAMSNVGIDRDLCMNCWRRRSAALLPSCTQKAGLVQLHTMDSRIVGGVLCTFLVAEQREHLLRISLPELSVARRGEVQMILAGGATCRRDHVGVANRLRQGVDD